MKTDTNMKNQEKEYDDNNKIFIHIGDEQPDEGYAGSNQRRNSEG